SGSSLYQSALSDLLDGKAEAAFSKLRQVVTHDTNNIEAYLRLGQILREHNRSDKALEVHRDLTLRSGLGKGEKSAILRQLTCDYLALGELSTAEKALKELIAVDDKSHWAYSNLLKLYHKQSKWEAAFDTAVIVLKLESDKSKKPLATYKFEMAQELYRKREYHKARIVYKEAIGLDPAMVEAYLAIGDSYAQESRLEDAIEFWNKLIAAVPDRSDIVIERLKKTLFELGRYGDIVEICENILSHAPRNMKARRTLAEFYEKKGDLNLAREQLESLTDDFPDDLPTLVELMRLYLEQDERRKLAELLSGLERRLAKQDISSGTPPTPETTPVPS
ncbi:MAG: tetratricopeptide repeat protein, partial [candidate division Zixibacteria bacterium]